MMMLQGIAIIVRRVLAEKYPVQFWLPVRLVGIEFAESFLVTIFLHNLGDLGDPWL